MIKNAAIMRNRKIHNLNLMRKFIIYIKMKKLLFVFALAFVAFTQVTMAQNPVLNIYVQGPNNSTSYDIYYQIVDYNGTVLAGPLPVATNHCFPLDGIIDWIDEPAYFVTLTPPNPSPKNYCKVQVGVFVSGTIPTPPYLAAGASAFMSFDEVITSAEPVRIIF
ncbi:MAG: hypothetical protein A2X11_11820 [Bacteroidetes bacterium GWE2_42_24]|nr:MAG: hypothetical protein A2X11_11820 [Bacteroidetes bacterium GWE2_42_24]